MSTLGYRQADMLPKLRDSRITFEDIATFPRPGCAAPDSIAFSPDDSVVTYLASADGSLTRQLYAMDIVSGEVRAAVPDAPSVLAPVISCHQLRYARLACAAFDTCAASIALPPASILPCPILRRWMERDGPPTAFQSVTSPNFPVCARRAAPQRRRQPRAMRGVALPALAAH